MLIKASFEAFFVYLNFILFVRNDFCSILHFLNKTPMKKIIFVLLLLVLFSAYSLPVQSQEKVYMPYIEVLNMHPDYQYSVSRLFVSYIQQNNSKFEIVLPNRPDSGLYYETPAIARENAARIQAPYYIIADMNRIGETVIVSLGLYKTADGSKVWFDMLKAQNPEDLDPIMLRLAKNMGTPVKASDAGDIYSVTQYDSKELNRQQANFNYGISVGGSKPFFSADDNFATGFGLHGTYDARYMLIDMNASFHFSHLDIIGLNLNVYHPFSSSRNTPFIGGGMGFGSMSYRYEYPDNSSWNSSGKTSTAVRGSGLVIQGGGGYILNRNSNVQIRLTAQAYYSLFDIKNYSTWLYDEVPDYYKKRFNNPFGIAFNMAILF